jgi:hypothetical protein
MAFPDGRPVARYRRDGDDSSNSGAEQGVLSEQSQRPEPYERFYPRSPRFGEMKLTALTIRVRTQ